MKKRIYVLIRLILGFILCGSSTVFMINSNLGLSPWDVLHEGIAKNTGITIGQANIMIGVAFVILAMCFGQKLGVGTVLNMILVGQFIDIIIYLDFIPVASNTYLGIIMMIIGMAVMGIGCYFYIGCGLGCGPRDGVMITLSNKFNKPIKSVRMLMEVLALVIGYILGGTVGLGTLITAIFLGHSIQLIFRIFNFEVGKVEHESVMDTIVNFMNKEQLR